jgi:hypothetical protein
MSAPANTRVCSKSEQRGGNGVSLARKYGVSALCQFSRLYSLRRSDEPRPVLPFAHPWLEGFAAAPEIGQSMR